MPITTTISIILKDNSKKEIPSGSTGLDLAKAISNSLAKKSVGLLLNNELRDLVTVLKDNDKIEIITQEDPRSYEFLRHSTAHILAEAVQNIFKGAKIAIGPVIEDGFYYDFEIPDHKLIPEDLLKIEKEMQRLIDEEQKFIKINIQDTDKQLQEFQLQGEKFKAELLNQYKNDNPTLYVLEDKSGKPVWNDLCRGPHIIN